MQKGLIGEFGWFGLGKQTRDSLCCSRLHLSSCLSFPSLNFLVVNSGVMLAFLIVFAVINENNLLQK